MIAKKELTSALKFDHGPYDVFSYSLFPYTDPSILFQLRVYSYVVSLSTCSGRNYIHEVKVEIVLFMLVKIIDINQLIVQNLGRADTKYDFIL